MSGDRHDMGDATWEIVRLVLPHWRWDPERVHDRRVINGIFFVLRTGTPRRDLPERYGPYTTCCNRTTTDGTGTAPRRRSWRSSRGLRVMSTGATTGATTVHLGIDANAIVKAVFQTPGQAADCTQAGRFSPGSGRARRWPETGRMTPTPSSISPRRSALPRSFRRGPVGSRHRRLIARLTGRATLSKGSSARSRSSARWSPAMTSPPATSCLPCIWLPAGSCAARSKTSCISPQPRQVGQNPIVANRSEI